MAKYGEPDHYNMCQGVLINKFTQTRQEKFTNFCLGSRVISTMTWWLGLNEMFVFRISGHDSKAKQTHVFFFVYFRSSNNWYYSSANR